MDPRRQMGRVEPQDGAQFPQCFRAPAQAPRPQGQEIPAVDLVAAVQVVVEDQELRKGHGEIVDGDPVPQMRAGEADRGSEPLPGPSPLPESRPGEPPQPPGP